MSSPLGQYGSKGYESSESRTLGKFQSDKFSYREQAKNIIELNNAVGYMSGYMRKMQRGIDEANQNFVQQIQGLLNDFLVLIGGGGDTGFEFGDLKYILMAIGALFGFANEDGEITLPINLFEAAWHFFATYILPTDSFVGSINLILDSLIATVLDIFGEVPILGQALQQLAVIISDIRDLLAPVFDALEAFLNSFNLSIVDLPGITNLFGPFAPIMDSLIRALEGIHLPDFTVLFHEIAQWTVPFIDLIVNIITVLDPILNTVIGVAGGAVETLVWMIVPIFEILGPIIDWIAPVIEGLFPYIEAIIEIVNQFIDLVGGIANLPDMFLHLLTGDSPLNSLNLFNIIPRYAEGFLPFTHVGEGAPNLLANPDFAGNVSVQGSAIWLWDELVGKTTLGSTSTTGNGEFRRLVSNAIPVSPGHQLAFSVWTKWAGLQFTDVPIKLQVLRLFNYAHVAVDTIDVVENPTSDQNEWVQLAGIYPVPDNTDMVCLQLTVTDDVSAGKVWFDEGDVRKLGSPNPFIPPLNIFGVGGPENILDSIKNTWDKIIAGLVDVPGAVGSDPNEFWGIFNDIGKWASQGRNSWDILGIRNNKPLDFGLLPTSIANFGLSRITTDTAVPKIAIPAGQSAIAFIRCEESNDKGVVSWLGYGTTGGLYVNIWKMNISNGNMDLVHTSPNLITIAGAVHPSEMNFVIYDEDFPIPVKYGEVYGIEIQATGSGTHYVSGSSSWMPRHPNVFPQRMSAKRASGAAPPVKPATIPGASVDYGVAGAYAPIPWVEWGIHSVETAGYYSPRNYLFNVPRSGSIGSIPTWANFVDVVVLGSGAGGGGGGLYGIAQHNGGGAGKWNKATWVKGTHFFDGDTLDITVSKGGAGGSTLGGGETNGDKTIVTVPGRTTKLEAAGGTITEWNQDNGQGAGHNSLNGVYYEGGAQQGAHSQPGIMPGGGGASGPDIIGGPGGAGATGSAWIVYRQS